MNEFYFSGVALEKVDVYTSENGTKYGTLKVKVKRSYKNKDGIYDDDLLQVTMFKSSLEDTQDITDGTGVLIKGHLTNNNYSKDGKVYWNPSLVADRVEILN